LTIINFKVDDEKKKKIEQIVEVKGYKSVSEFIREAIDDKMNLQNIIDDFVRENPPLDEDKINIPEFIPDGKYLGIARNEIVVIGDTLEEVMQKLYDKFPRAASGIIRKGESMPKFETLFSLFSVENTKCFNQSKFENNFFPILEISVEINGVQKELLGLVDTGASIIALNKDLFQNHDLPPIRTSEILTANGITQLPIYNSTFKYENQELNLDFTLTELTNPLKIQALIGKNFIDKFNLLLLGNEKLFCLQPLKK
jgi:predicted aspartyl protease/Arc/MetJ-type ribon-helix-helix transcriptional regulator